MKKKIAILGSTGSIGDTLLNIVKKDSSNIKVILLTANSNYKKLLKQAKKFKVKNLIINCKSGYKLLKKKTTGSNIKVFNDYNSFNKIFKKKVDYVMSSIVGIEGLLPTYKIIKFTKNIAIANKESIICGWNLISKELGKNKTNFIPVVSEHFSIWYALNNIKKKDIKKIYITASGGSLLNYPINKFNEVKLAKVLKHPNWKMGKKITVDSSTMMNKVFEIIEAKKIFNLKYEQLSILIHPDSYVHALIDFEDGLKKIIAHDTTMTIPIFNSLYYDKSPKIKSKKINLYKLNNLNFSRVNRSRFPITKILKYLPSKDTLFETVIVSANDRIIELYLKKYLNYNDIYNKINTILNLSEFKKLKNKKPKNLNQIYKLNKYVRLKVDAICI